MAGIADNPGSVGIIQQEQRPAVVICRSVYGGTLVLREAPGLLPQYEKEDDDVYADRLEQTVLFNAYKKTIGNLTGVVFRDDPEVEEKLLPAIVEHLVNIDLTGQSLQVVAREEFQEKLIDGHVNILVDWHGPEGSRSKRDDTKGMARPYWSLIPKSREVRSLPRNDSGKTVLMSFAYETEVVKRKGEFEQEETRRIRQYDLTTLGGEIIGPDDPLPPEAGRRVWFRSWLERELNSNKWDVEEEGKPLGPRMNEIPLVTDYADRTGFMQSDPLFLDLALEDLKHWQIRSDRDQSLHTVSIPIFLVYGMKADELQEVTVGTSIGLAFPGGRTEQGAEYAEAQGHGLEHTRTELQDIEQRMAYLGASILQRSTRQAETEEKVRLDQKGQDSELANQARLTNTAIRDALRLHAKWMGKEPGGSVWLNTDYSTQILSPQMIEVFLKAVGEGAMSLDVFIDRLVAGKIYPEGFDKDMEKDRIAEGGDASLRVLAEAVRSSRASAAKTAAELEAEEAVLES